MGEQTYEREIDLAKVFYRILRDWRKIFVISAIITIVVGSGNFALKKIKISNPENLHKLETNYNRELAAFNATGETLQREIENLEETRAEREDYNENSLLMKINPLREYNASLQIYIATNYQIMPGMNYQNIDLSGRILRSYHTYMQNGDMYQYILEHIKEPMELRYLKEILSIILDENSCLVTLGVRGVDAEICEEILMYALEGIHLKQPEIIAAVGEHELNTVNQSVYEAVNLDLDEWQKQNIQYVSELSIKLQEKSEEFAKWELSPEPKKEFSVSWIVKDSIKKMIISFIIGGILATIFIAFSYIMSDKLQDAKELKERFGLRVIAQIPRVHKKRVWVGLDRLFAHMAGLMFKENDVGALTKVASQSVCAELMVRGSESCVQGMKNDPKIKLVFTGNVSKEESEELLSGMSWGEGYSVQCVSNVLRDPAAIPTVTNADYIILVEKQEKSTYSEIGRELEAFKERRFVWSAISSMVCIIFAICMEAALIFPIASVISMICWLLATACFPISSAFWLVETAVLVLYSTCSAKLFTVASNSSMDAAWSVAPSASACPLSAIWLEPRPTWSADSRICPKVLLKERLILRTARRISSKSPI